MAGKIFDLDEPHPNVALERIRQAINKALADLIDAAGRDTELSGALDDLVIDALDVQIRDDGQDEAIDLLVLDSLSGGVA